MGVLRDVGIPPFADNWRFRQTIAEQLADMADLLDMKVMGCIQHWETSNKLCTLCSMLDHDMI